MDLINELKSDDLSKLCLFIKKSKVKPLKMLIKIIETMKNIDSNE